MRARRLATLAGLGLGVACASPGWQQLPHDRPFQRVPPPTPHPPPEPSAIFDAWYAFSQSTVRPLAVAANPGHYVEMAIGGPPPLDINHFGQVIDSPWFENRISRRRLTPAEIRRGPTRAGGPAEGPLTVIGGKVEGATPGLVVRDETDAVFIVKFDPPAFPGLSSGAELIATKILWAAGYHVPENYAVTLQLDRLRLDPNATTKGRFGKTVPLTKKRLQDLIALVNPFPDGTIRALFSRRLPGRLLGPFDYRGQRADDPLDAIPHERRRSLRGLWLFCSWLNNTDPRATNTMDVFVPSSSDPSLGYVKHYLLDFGDALGAAGTKPKFPGEGYETRLDWAVIARSFVSLGLWYRYWLAVQRSPFRSVGLFEAQIFDPARWRANLPNPAFDEAGPLDTYWAASIIARFGPDQLAAVVDEAGYTEPGAAAWVLRVLLARQYRVLSHAFSRVLPLENPRATGMQLRLDDLAVQANLLLDATAVLYRWQVRDPSGRELDGGQGPAPVADLTAAAEAYQASPDYETQPFLTVRWQRIDPDGRTPTVDVHLRVLPKTVLPVAMERQVR